MSTDHLEHKDFITSDPDARLSVIVGGGSLSIDGVTLSRQQLSNLRRIYGFVDCEDNLTQAGADRNLCRFAKRDGLRLIAAISKFCEAGEDPVKVIFRLLASNGYDIGCADWLEE